MFIRKILISFVFLMFTMPTLVSAGDFDWLKHMSIEAKADASGFKAKLATRFNIGDVKVNAVISDLGNGADAYMVMRLGEISGHDIDYVAEKYKANKSKGWGALAKSLGIKPGSRAFKALKRGDDLNQRADKGHGKGKNNSHKNEKHHGKGNKHDD